MCRSTDLFRPKCVSTSASGVVNGLGGEGAVRDGANAMTVPADFSLDGVFFGVPQIRSVIA